MIYQGKIRMDGSPDEFKQSEDPIIRQFINGESDGPFQI
jgi:phospholipid/cholesterol/gamma-HCH transport system ATP-binding protein